MGGTGLKAAGALLVTIAISNGLVACGGGGSKADGGSDWSTGNPASPTLSLTLAGHLLGFTWTDQTGITEYHLLENPDGQSGYTVIATLGPQVLSQNLNIFLPERIHASYILRACKSNVCTDSSAVFVSDNLAEAVGYIKASNTDANDRFGNAIALSNDGNTLIIGAYGEASNSAGINGNQLDDSGRGGDWGTGAVYVFTYSGTVWTQQAYIKASNPDEGDWFGHAVSVSADGNTLAVGAPYEDSNATGINGNQASNTASGTAPVDGSGALYVFIRNGISWSQQAYVKASNTDASDAFGYTLSLSEDGNTLAVGAPYEDSNATGIGGNQADGSAANSGAAYVFTRSGSTWSQQAYIKASNTEAADEFGYSLALSVTGNALAVGAPGEASNAMGVNGNQVNNAAASSGAAYVFTRSGSSWSQQTYLKASNTNASDLFGSSIALSGNSNTLAVGARLEDSAATGTNGNPSDNTATDSGAVYVFFHNGTAWAQEAYLKAVNTAAYDLFGERLSITDDGSKLVVGARYDDSAAVVVDGNPFDSTAISSGAASMFVRNQGVWTQQAYIKASNTGSGDSFGFCAIAGNGNRLAVGAIGESSNVTGVDGDQADNSTAYAGAVYLY